MKLYLHGDAANDWKYDKVPKNAKKNYGDNNYSDDDDA